MIKKESKFLFNFYKWSRSNKCKDKEEFKEKCKYSIREDWQKEMIDDYIEGVFDARK